MPASWAATEITYTGSSSDTSYGLDISGLLCPLQEFLARVRACGCLTQLLDGAARLAVQVLGHQDLDRDEQVAVGPVLAAHALATDEELPSVLRAGRDPHRHLAAPGGGHLDLGAERQLGECHRHLDGQVGAGPAEHR